MKTAVAHTRKVRNGSSRFLTTELVYYASAAPAAPTRMARSWMGFFTYFS